MKPRDIFGLAVRLLGLFFLYLGLRAITALLDLGAIETASVSDLINAFLPVIFDLAVAWWLLGSGWLVRRAYPETPKISDRFSSLEKRATPSPDSAPSPELANMEKAEKKLAALVKEPNSGAPSDRSA